jgi:hypothetical protein
MATLFDDLEDFDDERDEGDRLRDAAFALFERHRPALVRHLKRRFVLHLIEHGPNSTDPLRDLVPLPSGVDPRIIGYIARSLACDDSVTERVGSTRTGRKIAHARHLDIWAVPDAAKARNWLDRHPDYSA